MGRNKEAFLLHLYTKTVQKKQQKISDSTGGEVFSQISSYLNFMCWKKIDECLLYQLIFY